MEHPFFDKYWKIMIYSLSFISLGFLYYFYFSGFKEMSRALYSLDSALFLFLNFSFGISLWYYIRLNHFEEKKDFQVALNILGASLFFPLFTVFGSHFIMLLFAGNLLVYTQFFWNNIFINLTISLIIFSVLLLFYYLIIYYNKYKDNLFRKKQLIIDLKEQELVNLKAKINPHFLFNSLNSISYLVYENPEKAHHSIVQLSDYFRYSLSSTQEQFTSLEKEIANLERYLEIEKIRFEEKLVFEISIDEKCKNVNVPVLILQPLVENAIKHGVYESSEKVIISLNCENHPDFIKISLKNNFEKNEKKKKGQGYGLQYVANRLKLLYNREDLLQIRALENEFLVELYCPKNKK